MEWDGTEDDQRLLRINLVARMKRMLHDPMAHDLDLGAFLREMV